MSDTADLWESELGAFDIEVDDSAAAARRERIEASRRAAKGYTAKVEEPGWYNDPVEVARSKGPARPALFVLHQQYFQRRFEDAVRGGLELLRDGVKEETEVIDLVMRAAVRCGQERREDVLALARRWPEFPNLPSLSLVSARVLLANSPIARPTLSISSSDSPLPPVSTREVLSATLSSLRTHPSLPSARSFLSTTLSSIHPLLAQTIDDPSILDQRRRRDKVEHELGRVEVGEKEGEVLRRVLGLDRKDEKEEEEEEEEGEHIDAGRNVRSL
ncbi:hypothetical protein Rt10032_c13g5096 [Rhodotorula toruloides]|uniref:Uncharacterized protein n=1 Tax=Rhodotorula toruloides TaxID=5286 RepID=A0A511KL27_RHOTO|nr:hypothetical protein Rt10032_c13g5096 [Rhodotorula toruloides]